MTSAPWRRLNESPPHSIGVSRFDLLLFRKGREGEGEHNLEGEHKVRPYGVRIRNGL